MIDLKSNFEAPGLLVSVRNDAEALTALAARADVIDVKEPARGPLGAADAPTIAAVVAAVDGRAPVTAAMGELTDLIAANRPLDSPPIPAGVSLFKIGLAGCGGLRQWQPRWRDAIAALSRPTINSAPQPVAVVYADWRSAGAPPPEDVLRFAVKAHCPALLIDTWNKSAGGLFDHWPADDLRTFMDRVRTQNLPVVLAGSLEGTSFGRAIQMRPDLVAVRTAACDAGRGGIVSYDRVRALKQAIAASHLAECAPRFIQQH